MQTPRWRSALRIAGVLLAVAGGLFQLSLHGRLIVATARFPWDIEWLESTSLYQAYRFMHGMGTYGPPRDGYLPINHPPLYTAALGMLGRVVGLDYGMARTVSMLLYLGAAALVVRALVRHFEGRLEGYALGALAIGCASAGVPLVDGFYDLAREDILALFLSVLAAALVDSTLPPGGVRGSGARPLPIGQGPRLRPRRIALLALVLGAIVYTRQPAVFFAVWVALFVFLRHPRTGLLLGLVTTALCGLVLVVLQFASRGWYWMHTVALLQIQAVSLPRFAMAFKLLFTFAPFTPAILFGVLFLAFTRRLSARAALWVGMLVASLPASLLPFAKVGGYSNDFIPTVFLIGPAAAFVVADVICALGNKPRVRLFVQTAFLAAGAAFLFLRSYDFKRWVPPADTLARAQKLNARIASLKGGVIDPRHPFLPIHNGDDTPQWSDMPYLDMMWAGFNDLDLGGYIDRGHARWAVLSGTEIPGTAREIGLRFQLEERLDGPMTLIGEHSSARYLLRRNDDETNGHVLFDFESLDGWTVTGDAFALTPSKTAWQAQIQGVIGKHLANSYSQKGKDPARGMLASPKFVIDRPHMSLRVGGGTRPQTRAELRVGGRAVKTATGIFEQNEAMTRVVWDVSAYQGKEAQLYVIDEDAGAWGHMLCDHVVLY
jgi:hypothetical protein